MKSVPIGDTALTLTLPPPNAPQRAVALAEQLQRSAPVGVTHIVPAFDRITILYDPAAFADPIAHLNAWAEQIAGTLAPINLAAADAHRLIEIPVHYGTDDAGPDLLPLAKSLKLTPQQLIDRHTGATYTVAAIGFLPGFAYLAGLHDSLHAPRRPTPRVRVPAGSVAIGGPYTGVYPVDSPGGWHLIGRTAMRLFDPANPAAVPLRVGDRVRFVPQR